MLPQSPPIPCPSATISNKRLLTRMTTTAASVKLLQLTQTRTHRHTHAWTRTDMYTLCGHLLPFLKGLKPDRAPRGAVGEGEVDASALCVFWGIQRKREREKEKERNAKSQTQARHALPRPLPGSLLWGRSINFACRNCARSRSKGYCHCV